MQRRKPPRSPSGAKPPKTRYKVPPVPTTEAPVPVVSVRYRTPPPERPTETEKAFLEYINVEDEAGSHRAKFGDAMWYRDGMCINCGALQGSPHTFECPYWDWNKDAVPF